MTEILRLSLPITLWLIGFSAVYGLQGLSCSRHGSDDLNVRAVLLAAVVAAIVVQVVALATVLRAPSRSGFVQATATALAVTALVAAVWTLLPALTTSVCL